MTATSIEVPVHTDPPRLGYRFEVDFDHTRATVSYRACRTSPDTDTVLTVHHNAGHGLHADWTERWRKHLAPAVRGTVVAEVQRLLIDHYR